MKREYTFTPDGYLPTHFIMLNAMNEFLFELNFLDYDNCIIEKGYAAHCHMDLNSNLLPNVNFLLVPNPKSVDINNAFVPNVHELNILELDFTCFVYNRNEKDTSDDTTPSRYFTREEYLKVVEKMDALYQDIIMKAIAVHNAKVEALKAEEENKSSIIHLVK